MDKFTILVVDDDKLIARAISTYLEQNGYNTLTAYDGIDAINKINENNVTLLLLDIMMPKLDGLSTLIELRKTKNIPIILVSAKSEKSDKILGLSMGADDYITKPFDLSELLARVKANIRRYNILGDSDKIEKNTIIVNNLEINMDEKSLKVSGENVKLTAKEYSLLEFFVKNPNKVFSTDQIYENVWQDIPINSENTVMVHIRKLREKIEINPKSPKYIKVVWGIGYKFENK